MRSTLITHPLLDSPYEVLTEIALRLPAVKSTKPWRDVNSLASTCKQLTAWKKNKINENVKYEWSQAKKKINAIRSWRKGLETIISNYENSSSRLFREPILRKIADRYPVPKSEKENQSYGESIAKIFENREMASLKEIGACISVCGSSSLNIKIRVVTALPSLLITLSREDRLKVLRSMFDLIDKDKKLGNSLIESDIFEMIEESLYGDHQSKALLELGLHSRELLSRGPLEDTVKKGLSLISDAERWDWVKDSAPECLKTKLGMRLMLDDAACHTKMLGYLDRSFSDCLDNDQRIEICQPMSEVYPMLDETEKGKKLIARIDKWFFHVWIKKEPYDNSIAHKYVKLLCIELDRHKLKSMVEKRYLKDKLGYALNFFSTEIKEFEQSTSLLIAIARNHFDYWFDMYRYLTNRDALKHALSYTDNLPDLRMQYRYVSVLKTAAKKYFKKDINLISELTEAKSAIKKSLKVDAAKH